METNSSQYPTPDPRPITVALVDDHKIIADGLERLLGESQAIRVIWKAYSVSECLEMLKGGEPGVLMLDIGLPDGNGVDLCARVKADRPHIRVMMLTSYSELATISRALEAGADGYILKNGTAEEMIEGVCAVASGKRFLCEEVSSVLRANENNQIELTRREMELLQLIVDGYTLPEQADKMCLGYNTVRGYRQKLNIKLGAHNTVQLIQIARAMKLV